jgi:ABC-type transport system involved in multi-copper enzyme maturation permease subunit
MTAVALRMTGADFLKLRKKRGTLIWALVLALAPVVIMFIFREANNSSTAGGVSAYRDSLRVIALIFGPLAAILIGTDGGAIDTTAGVFRDMVVTGRSRLALFGARVPASLALCWLIVMAAYLTAIVGTFAFAGGEPTPDTALLANGLAFSLFSTGVVCVVAVGFASLTTSRPAALTVLIMWHLIASPILANITSLGSARNALLSQAFAHFSPLSFTDGGGGGHGGHGPGAVVLTMSGSTAVIVVLGWLAVFLALGAWRTRTMDA